MGSYLGGLYDGATISRSDQSNGYPACGPKTKGVGGRLVIIEADAFTWKWPRGMHYNVVWHDVWDDICADNYPEMMKLLERYHRRCDWQGCWCFRQTEKAWKGFRK